MIGVLFRLQWMQLKGRVVRSIRLLRQPKYLVGFLVGAMWMGLWVVRPMLKSRIGIGSVAGNPLGAELLPVFRQLVALVVAFALPLPWLLPWGRLGLPFRESELTMLLQAPLTRRQVIQYGLLKSEIGVLISALILPLFVGLGGLRTRLLMGCGTWLLFEFWHLNGKWRALFIRRQAELPAGLARARRLAVTIGLVGFYAALAWGLRSLSTQILAASRGADVRQVAQALSTMTWPPLLRAVSTPAWWLTAPMFAGGAAAFVLAAAPVLLAVVAQREIVLRSKARFEESALERAAKEEGRKSPARRFAAISSRARTSHPFALDRNGPPEIALVWKNAMRVSRTRWLSIGYFGAAVLVVIAVLPAALRLHEVVYSVLAVIGAASLVVQPLLAGMTWNNDLRSELAYLEMVRTWPVPARRFVLAEVISPALLSFATAVLGAGIFLASQFGSHMRETLTGHRSYLVLFPRTGVVWGLGAGPVTVLLVASVLPMAAALAFFSSAAQNLATLFVPAWMAHSADRSRGFAVFGQRLLVSAALGLAVLLALIPGALLVGAAAALQWWLRGPWSAWAFPFWGVLAAAPLFALGWLLVQVAGRLWERLDPSQEILEMGR